MPDDIHEGQRQNTKIPNKRIVNLLMFIVMLGAFFLIWQRIQLESKRNTEQQQIIPEPDRAMIGTELGLDALIMNLKTERDKKQPLSQIEVVHVPHGSDNKAVQIYVQPKQRSKAQAQTQIQSQMQTKIPDEEMIRIGAQLRNTKVQALQAPSHVGGFIEQDKQQQDRIEQQNSLNSLVSGLQNLPPLEGNLTSPMNSLALLSGQDQNGQSEKQGFLYSRAAALTPHGYSQNIPVPQQFPLELKAGTLIPGILISGLNSDLPGSVLGQVSEHVYDTATGRYVLIPKGSRLIGVYSSNVTYGQSRVLVVWNRIVFPNGTSLNIAGSQGMDRAGYSGMSGAVDSHWGKVISAAVFASLFIAGAEILNPKDGNTNNNSGTGSGSGTGNKSPSQAMSEAVANSILEMGGRMLEKAMNIQPTIKIRPGARFNIFVAQDVVFPNTW